MIQHSLWRSEDNSRQSVFSYNYVCEGTLASSSEANMALAGLPISPVPSALLKAVSSHS